MAYQAAASAQRIVCVTDSYMIKWRSDKTNYDRITPTILLFLVPASMAGGIGWILISLKSLAYFKNMALVEFYRMVYFWNHWCHISCLQI